MSVALLVISVAVGKYGFLLFSELKLQEFHRKYYHPSNSRIWFYGDDDPYERLRILSGNK